MTITAGGRLLDTAATAFGELRRSDDIVGDADELRRRMSEDGYLFLPGFFDRDTVLRARRDLLARMVDQLGDLDRAELGTDPTVHIGETLDGRGTRLDELPSRSALLQDLLYGVRMCGFFELFFGEEIRHFDYTWFRTVNPGDGTKPHMDSVFMNRGTPKLLTAWTPLGDIDRTLGGLAILEGSHRVDHLVNDYASHDVDTYCDNSPTKERPWKSYLSDDAVALREELGLRWLTADFRAGDMLTFTMYTGHMGLDNNSGDRIRMSTDSRYQPASEPADHRWIGPNPIGHGPDGKRGLIC